MTRPGAKTQHMGRRRAPSRARRPMVPRTGAHVNNSNKANLEKAAQKSVPSDKQVGSILDALRAAGQPRD